MGNKLGKRRQLVDDQYTRPQGLYQHGDVDIKKLRKLILNSKLAPCYPGDDDCVRDLEECPICFLYYPSLNRSRCCTKGICTECFLQMKSPNSTRPTQCPFCKTSNYAVEYRGVKTKEEKGIEQIEEQRVIEAKIRMRQQELQGDKEKMQKRLDTSSSGITVAAGEVGCSTVADFTFTEREENFSPNEPYTLTTQSMSPGHNRFDDFDLDIEDLMVMEAVWLSIQENVRQKIPNYADSIRPEQYMTGAPCLSPTIPPMTESSSSASSGLACAIAALAERQQSGGESSSNYGGTAPSYNNYPGCSRFASSRYSPECHEMTIEEKWSHGGSELPMVGTSGQNLDATEGYDVIAPQHEIAGGFQSDGGAIIPQSYEEQMMLAMAVSLAEAQAMASYPELHGGNRY